MQRFSMLSLMSLFAVACGAASPSPQTASKQPAPVAPAAAAVEHQADEAQATTEPDAEQEPVQLLAVMPPDCDGEAPCEPPIEFTRAVCKGKYPALAVAMFEKGSPWQRMYLKVAELEAVNAYGSRSTSGALVYGEEVLVLRGQAAANEGQMQISGSGDIDLLRWDGTCVTARQEMFAPYMMPEIANAPINLRRLDDDIKHALLEQKYVKLMYERRRAACKGSRRSNATPECARADKKLNDAITVAVRGGMDVPAAERIPAWATPQQALPRKSEIAEAEARVR